MPAESIAYAGAGHTRRAARAALVALLADHDFGGFADLRAARAPDSDGWPGIKSGPLVTTVLADDPRDMDWQGVSGLYTRLAVISESVNPDAFLGGPGAEVFAGFAIDWLVVATGAVADWRDPVFDHVLGQIGAILSTQRLTRSDHFLDLEVGEAELMQFDLGETVVSSASVPVSLILDSATLLA